MSQLRSFSAYDKNANAGINLVANPCNLVAIDGNYVSGAAGQYFQIHDKATAPVNADVPLKSIILANAGPVNLPSMFETIGPMPFTLGLGVAISATNETLTLGTGSFDVYGETEEWETVPSGLSTAGDLTTGRDHLVVWANGSGPLSLYQFDFVNNTGATVYVMLFAKTSPSDGYKPIIQLKYSSATTKRTQYLGASGSYILQNIGGTLFKGCDIAVSSTPEVLTQTTDTSCYIRAYYK